MVSELLRKALTPPRTAKARISHRMLTDVYLLGLAKVRKGHLATLDRTIPLKAVRGATPATLQVIAPLDATAERVDRKT